MHTLVEVPVGANGGTHVPAFLAKLWKIVDDPSTNDLICWSEMSNSFIIKNQAKFARDLLPLYYKHNNMASFVRQLNMYGFHKVVSVEQGGLRVDKDEMEFAHPFFLKGQETSLELIKRKIPASKHEETKLRPDSFNKVLMDVRQMKGRQETMDNKLVNMKRENEALWRELASLRQKHAKQTQIVSKLLQFLVGMMSQQTQRLAFKRRMPLMLNDKEGVKQKLARTDASEPTGPVIHDVTELLESDDSVEDVGYEGGNASENFKIDSPLSVSAKSSYSDTVPAAIQPEIIFAVNNTAGNPTVTTVPATTLAHFQQPVRIIDQSKAVKGKVQPKKTSPATTTVASIKAEPTVVALQNIHSSVASNNAVQVQPQFIQVANIAPLTSQTQNVPTTLYFTPPGMTDPIQLVLSMPDQTSTTITTPAAGSSISSNSTPIVVPSTNTPAASKGLNVQQHSTVDSTSNSKATLSSLNLDGIGRNQPANPKLFVKSNGSIVQEDLDGHLDEVEEGLNHLRDLFKGDQHHMDGNTLIGLGTPNKPFFNLAAIDPDTYKQLFDEAPAENTENQGNQGSLLQMSMGIGGDAGETSQEVVSYNPSLFELADDSNFFDESSNIFLDDELESMLTTDRDSLKRPAGPSRDLGQLTFAGIGTSNLLESSLHTPVSELPGTSSGGSSKRKRK